VTVIWILRLLQPWIGTLTFGLQEAFGKIPKRQPLWVRLRLQISY